MSVMRIVGCFLEHDGRFVILLRQAHKPDGNTWGLPGGKVDPGETDRQAARRELCEETGYQATDGELRHLGDYDFISSRGEPYVYVAYVVQTAALPDIQLEAAAHTTCQWVTPAQCDALPDLISGFHDLLRRAGYLQQPTA